MVNPECELCSEQQHRLNREPPCDFCPYYNVVENFKEMESEVEQFKS
jgi:hypothetical protein